MSKFEPRPFGKYFLTDRIAIGGMAEIYKAKTFGVDGFEKSLAIKKILPHYSSDPNFVTMLTDEAKLVVHLSHPNIVQVYDLGRVRDDYFISMEYINGVNLRELVNRADELGESIPEPVCLYIVAEVCKGLDYAHSKRAADGEPLGIVHRDVSPHNILVSFDSEVKIVDFGIAKAALNVSNTQFGTLKGKVTYMSPEQALGKPIDARADIFSLGTVLYELITGKRFFSGDSQIEVLEKIKKTRVTRDHLKQKILEPVLPVLLKSLEYKLKNRFATAADMQVALTRLLFEEYPDFTPRQLSSLLARWFGRTPVESSLSQITPSRLPRLPGSEEGLQQVTLVHHDETPPDDQDTLKAGEIHPLKPDEQTEKAEPSILRVPKKNAFEKFSLRIAGWIVAVVVLLVFGFAGVHWIGGTEDVTSSPAKKPAATVSGYSIQVISDPEGADVFLDDASMGKLTPTEFQGLRVGQKYRLRLVKEGFEDFVDEVLIAEARDQILDVKLTSHPLAMLNVTSVPSGAVIFMNGHTSGFVTPHAFNQLARSQKVVVSLRLNDYKEKSEVVSVGHDADEIVVHFDLERIIRTYDVQISSSVSGAMVWLNGQNYGLTPLETTLPEGKYTLILRLDGYQDVIQTFVVRENKKDISVVMQKQ